MLSQHAPRPDADRPRPPADPRSLSFLAPESEADVNGAECFRLCEFASGSSEPAALSNRGLLSLGIP
jgi:hypothetical protein